MASFDVEQKSTVISSPQVKMVHITAKNVGSCNGDMILGYKKNISDSINRAENSVRVIKCEIHTFNVSDGVCTFECRCVGTCTLYLINRGLDESRDSKVCNIAVS